MSASQQKAELLTFLDIMDSFNFAQFVHSPTHNRGHTLDLVFTLGLTIPTLAVEDLGISDHSCIKFSTILHTIPKLQLPASYTRKISSSTAEKFSNLYMASSLSCGTNLCSPFI